ncbi:hypothetical protein ACH79_33955 [Bradyrhizobium sp. CCBAU 051011]|uniref:hypothetical protein n=1 Tax=Bradyrhizobium sp. CCBAU 051011 TaxID=858422 RepID=UPI0013742624|nr:hypothetical protein [Bradyrhizobium sp. CCBAU 051011]QHO76900.1 hypothetical protein ACH79_33955 [Bradyrhizobium sp. CCBAU 051011]
MHTRSKRYVRRQRGRQKAADRRAHAKYAPSTYAPSTRPENRLAFQVAAGLKKRWPNVLPFSI